MLQQDSFQVFPAPDFCGGAGLVQVAAVDQPGVHRGRSGQLLKAGEVVEERGVDCHGRFDFHECQGAVFFRYSGNRCFKRVVFPDCRGPVTDKMGNLSFSERRRDSRDREMYMIPSFSC